MGNKRKKSPVWVRFLYSLQVSIKIFPYKDKNRKEKNQWFQHWLVLFSLSKKSLRVWVMIGSPILEQWYSNSTSSSYNIDDICSPAPFTMNIFSLQTSNRRLRMIPTPKKKIRITYSDAGMRSHIGIASEKSFRTEYIYITLIRTRGAKT